MSSLHRATTHDEFRRFIQADAALERRFTPVVVREPTVAETVEILSGLLARYEEHHRVRYARAAVEAAASLAARYVTDRQNPDKGGVPDRPGRLAGGPSRT